MLDGILVPFYVEEYRFRSDSTALVKLEGVDSSERARMFTNVPVYFPLKFSQDAAVDGDVSWDFFVGFRVEDVNNGYIGDIVDVDTTTINTLFIIENDGEETLLPAQEEFIRGVDPQKKLITVELPDGLLDLDHAAPDEDE